MRIADWNLKEKCKKCYSMQTLKGEKIQQQIKNKNMNSCNKSVPRNTTIKGSTVNK